VGGEALSLESSEDSAGAREALTGSGTGLGLGGVGSEALTFFFSRGPTVSIEGCSVAVGAGAVGGGHSDANSPITCSMEMLSPSN
jgi:hypothetical protein